MKKESFKKALQLQPTRTWCLLIVSAVIMSCLMNIFADWQTGLKSYQKSKNCYPHLEMTCFVGIIQENMTWFIRNFTYTPQMGESGTDEVHIFAEDNTGSLSRLLTVYIGIFQNPCINGFCKGKIGIMPLQRKYFLFYKPIYWYFPID